MAPLLVLLLLFQIPPPDLTAGIELIPTDPHNDNWAVLTSCTQLHGYCRVFYKPGTYYLQTPVRLPPMITHAYFKDVHLIPCAKMDAVVYYADPINGFPSTQMHDLYVDLNSFQACGTFVPPLKQAALIQ